MFASDAGQPTRDWFRILDGNEARRVVFCWRVATGGEDGEVMLRCRGMKRV